MWSGFAWGKQVRKIHSISRDNHIAKARVITKRGMKNRVQKFSPSQGLSERSYTKFPGAVEKKSLPCTCWWLLPLLWLFVILFTFGGWKWHADVQSWGKAVTGILGCCCHLRLASVTTGVGESSLLAACQWWNSLSSVLLFVQSRSRVNLSGRHQLLLQTGKALLIVHV